MLLFQSQALHDPGFETVPGFLRIEHDGITDRYCFLYGRLGGSNVEAVTADVE